METLTIHRSPATLESEWYREKMRTEAKIRALARALLTLCAEEYVHLGFVDQAVGFVISEAEDMFPAADEPKVPRSAIKAKIPASLRTEVYERDAYRCVTCGGHTALSLDHIIPESKGGPTTSENLQTMCRPCNSSKGVSMPE